MQPRKLADTIADLLKQCGHPDITDVTVLADGTVQVTFVNGSQIWAKAAHIAPAKASTPPSPSWPGQAASSPAAATNGKRVAA